MKRTGSDLHPTLFIPSVPSILATAVPADRPATESPSPKKILVWDLPLRLFHWVFAGSITAAFTLNYLMDYSSTRFQLHMLFGLIAGFALAVRLVLGVVGSHHNRFAAMPVRPDRLFRYLVSTVTGKARRYIGHNPGAAAVALLMFAMVPLLIASGIGWINQDFHKAFAITLGLSIIAHLAGIIWHTIRHREPIAVSMISGKKAGEEADGLKSASPYVALVIVIAGAAWICALFANYDADAATVKLPLTHTVIHLEEQEDGNDDANDHDH